MVEEVVGETNRVLYFISKHYLGPLSDHLLKFICLQFTYFSEYWLSYN